jgi:hypothetical protein
MSNKYKQKLDHPDKDNVSHGAAHAFLRSGCRCRDYRGKLRLKIDALGLYGIPVSPVAYIYGTKLGLEQSISKMTSGSVATRASA